MGKVISIHRYQVKPGSTQQDFMDTIVEAVEMELFDLPGLESYRFMFGIKGEDRGRWSAIWVYSSRESWERLWGTTSKPKTKAYYPEKWRRWEDELLAPLLDGDPDTISFSVYEERISIPDHGGGFMNQTIPTLRTERLVLRPFKIADAEDVARFVGEKVIAANTLSIPHPYELQMAEDWIATHAQSYMQDEGINFAITLQEQGNLVGAIGLTLQRGIDRAEMGYWIGKPHWNKGYASEAARKVVEFGFESWNLERIYARHFADNPASGKVIRNAGLRYEGCLRHHVKKWGQYKDLNVYGLLRSEWQ